MQFFQTTAINKDGLRFQVRFVSAWGTCIQKDAQDAVDAAVAKDAMHQKYGPFTATQIDVTA